MYFYSAYGLKINSAIPLPELLERKDGGADITIQRGRIERPLPETDETGSYFESAGDEAYLFWDEVGAFLVREGKEIVVDALPGVKDQILRLPLLGTVLSAGVQQRGYLPLHASAVAIDGRAVAFLGPRGAGKSTMDAALYARGHDLVSDDSVVVNTVGSASPLVMPGFPQLKLFPAAAAELGYDIETLPRLIPNFEKRGCRADRFYGDAILLHRIYVLDSGSMIKIEQLRSQEAIIRLISQSYMARVFKYSLKGMLATSHLFQCVDLANRVPVYKLKREFSLSELDDVARIVELDVKESLMNACAAV
jgi:hypothetical protein